MTLGTTLQRINKMKVAIQDQAKQRAQFIIQKAQDEADIQRNTIIKAEKEKIDKEYLQLMKVEKVKAKIQKSSMINNQRIKKMHFRHSLVENLKKSVNEELLKITNNQNKYGQFLEKLIVQGMLKMLEKNIFLQCKIDHRNILQGCIQNCEKLFFQTMQKQTGFGISSKLSLSEYNLESDNKNIIGGVFLRNFDGNIVCNNSMDARIGLIFQHLLPVIRLKLFMKKEKQ